MCDKIQYEARIIATCIYDWGYSVGTMGCTDDIEVRLTVFFWNVLGSVPNLDYFICHMYDKDYY